MQASNYSKNRAELKSIKDYCDENDFSHLLLEWDYEENKNDPKTPNAPEEASYSCNRKIHWKCSVCGYKWVAEPHFRYLGKYSCPNCNNKLLVPNENDLYTWCIKNNMQIILDEWDYEKNIAEGQTSNTPNDTKYDTYSKVHWKCSKCGHMWMGRVADRTIHHKGCGICAKTIRAQRHQKKVQIVETGQIFDSIKEAGIFLTGKPSTRIIDCCKGKCETALGYHWKYVEN